MTQRSLSDWNHPHFTGHRLCEVCRYRRKYNVSRCYHPEIRGVPCGIVIHEEWEAAGKPPRLSCRYMEPCKRE